MTMCVNVVFRSADNRTWMYSVPEGLRAQLKVGDIVVLPQPEWRRKSGSIGLPRGIVKEITEITVTEDLLFDVRNIISIERATVPF